MNRISNKENNFGPKYHQEKILEFICPSTPTYPKQFWVVPKNALVISEIKQEKKSRTLIILRIRILKKI